MTPWGKRWKRLLRRLEGRAHVLMYHRIADRDVDPWRLAVRPSRFAEHLEALSNESRVVPMNELAERVRNGRSIRGLVAITFDDGYADNADVARPLLERHGCPATFFVSTGVLGGATRFWWDVVEEIFLRRTSLPRRLPLGSGGDAEAIDLGSSAVLDDETRRGIRAWHADMPHTSQRTVAFHHVWSTLHRLDPERRELELDRLRTWAEGGGSAETDATDGCATMDADTLRSLAGTSLFDIGAHGVTHVALANVDEAVRAREIVGSVRTLEALLGRSVTGFAYPNGSHDDATRTSVRLAGPRYAVTTSGKPVARDDDPYALGRLHVGDVDADALMRMLGRRRRAPSGPESGRAQ